MNTFSEQCYTVVKKVPRGKVTTYKEIARVLKTNAYRAVGNAMRNNPRIPEVPCHRVVGSDGGLTGYAHGITRKRDLLQEEGVHVNKDKVDLKKYFYEFR